MVTPTLDVVLAGIGGGALIGVAAALVLLGAGRIAGVSGALGGLVAPRAGEWGWRAAFVAGLLAGGVLLQLLWPSALANTLDRSWGALLVAGLLVGVGTRMANGCTSGHGVCGTARLAPRSLVATMTFIATGAVTVLVVEHVFGGSP